MKEAEKRCGTRKNKEMETDPALVPSNKCFVSQGYNSCGDRPCFSHLKTCNVGGDLILLASTELAELSNVLSEKKTTAQIEDVSCKSHETHTPDKTPRLPSATVLMGLLI